MKIEPFSEENRKKYLKETRSSLDALLNDAFIGEDQNGIRSAFPDDSDRKSINMDNTKVSLNFVNDSKDPIREVAIQISFKENLIGEYKGVYDMTGELEDEFLYLE